MGTVSELGLEPSIVYQIFNSFRALRHLLIFVRRLSKHRGRPHCTRCYFCMFGPQGYNVSCCLTQHIVSCNGISKGAKAPFRKIEHRICRIFLLSKQFSLHKCYLKSTPYLKPRAYSFHLYQRVLSPEVKILI